MIFTPSRDAVEKWKQKSSRLTTFRELEIAFYDPASKIDYMLLVLLITRLVNSIQHTVQFAEVGNVINRILVHGNLLPIFFHSVNDRLLHLRSNTHVLLAEHEGNRDIFVARVRKLTRKGNGRVMGEPFCPDQGLVKWHFVEAHIDQN